jgi:hypothetical protein
MALLMVASSGGKQEQHVASFAMALLRVASPSSAKSMTL